MSRFAALDGSNLVFKRALLNFSMLYVNVVEGGRGPGGGYRD